MQETTQSKDNAQVIAAKIAALPPLPATAQRVLTCFGDEFIDVDKVAEIVADDPGICGKLLGLSNSAYFGLAEPVYEIRDAICRVLGVDTVRSLVLAMALQQSFNCSKCPPFDPERFWMQSLLTAMCCKRIAAAGPPLDSTDRDMAYSAGLCHNLGLMALAHMECDRTCAVLQTHRMHPESGTLGKLLRAEFKTDHKVLTAELAEFWCLPEPILAAYHCRAFPHLVTRDRLGLIICAAAAAVGNTEVDEEEKTEIDGFADYLGLEQDALQSMVTFDDRQKDNTRMMARHMTG